MKYFHNLRLRLLFIILIGLLPAYGIMVFETIQYRPLVHQQVYQDVLQHVNLVSNRLKNLTDQFHQILFLASLDPAIHNPTPEDCRRILSNISHTYYPTLNSIGIADLNGDLICHLPVKQECIGFNISGYSFFSGALTSKDFTVGEYGILPIGPTIGLAIPLFDHNGNVEEILYSIIAIDTLNEMIYDPGLPKNATVMLLDRNNTIIAHYPEPGKWVGKPVSESSYKISLGQKEGIYIDMDEAGVERLIAYTPQTNISHGDIKLLIEIPTTIAFAEVNKVLKINILVSILTSVFAMVVIWHMGNNLFEKQVHDRIQFVQKIADGDLNIEIDEENDIDRPKLINEFDRALGNLKTGEISRRQAVNAIRHQMARVEALSSTVRQLSAQHDLQSVLQISCEIVVDALHISACCIRLYEPASDAYFLRAEYGLEPDLLNDPEPLLGSVYHPYAASDDLYILNLNSRKELDLPKDLPEMRPDWVTAWVRMVHEDQNVGLLVLFAKDNQEASGLDDRALVQGLADAIGLSITNAQLFDELRSEQIRRERLMKQLISAQEEERVRIARELHDETSQSLSAIKVYIDTSILFIRERAFSKAMLHMESTKNLVSRTQDEIRRMIGALRPSLLDDMGLIPAISWYAEQRFNPMGINFTVYENKKGIRLPTTVETTLFRIAQESINNIVRHSHASEVNIFVKKADEEVILGIYDNGVGFEPGNGNGEINQNNGFGLTGMYERVKNLEGNIQIDTGKGTGTRIVIRIPLRKEDSLV